MLRKLAIACGMGCALLQSAFAAPVGDSAPSYDAPSFESNYAHSMSENRNTAGITPEDDARPGVYYFNLGASAFLHHDYAHAIDMYQVAASWAYKPAEYNLAVMYARGQGIPIDLPRALAWSALAAERNDKQYVDTRELINSLLTKQQFEQANVIWRDLKKTYGDEAAMPRAKARWADVRAHITGSRTGSVAQSLQVGVPQQHVTVHYPVDPISGSSPGPSTTNAAGIFHGGNHDDVSIAYAQLRESTNPYDPKFERPPLGTATVGPLTPVKDGAERKTEEAASKR